MRDGQKRSLNGDENLTSELSTSFLFNIFNNFFFKKIIRLARNNRNLVPSSHTEKIPLSVKLYFEYLEFYLKTMEFYLKLFNNLQIQRITTIFTFTHNSKILVDYQNYIKIYISLGFSLKNSLSLCPWGLIIVGLHHHSRWCLEL